jgi:hypothetical protein
MLLSTEGAYSHGDLPPFQWKKGLGLFPSAFPIYFISYIPSVCNLYWFSLQLLSIILVGQDKIKAIISKLSPSSLHIIFKYLPEYIIFLLNVS